MRIETGPVKHRRILLIVTKLSQAGTQLVALQLAHAFRSRGYIVETWFLYRETCAFENEGWIRVVCERRGLTMLDYLRLFPTLVRQMRKWQPDAVYTCMPLANVFGALAAWLNRCRIRVASQHYPMQTQAPLMRGLDWLMGSTGGYSANIAVSHAVAATFASAGRRYMRSMRVVQNGHVPRRSLLTQDKARAVFKLPVGVFTMGTVGRLADQKNPQHCVELLAQLPQAHLAMAGDGPLRAELEEMVRTRGLTGRAHLLGQIDGDAVPVFLRAIDVIIVPSRYEGLPLNVLEAMFAGVPVVASDIPSIRELVVDGDGKSSAILLREQDLESWIRALNDLRADVEQRRHLVETALARAQMFSLPRMVDGYEACLMIPRRR
jgi:glycosyltransferase involved in cell wall biosynthesis